MLKSIPKFERHKETMRRKLTMWVRQGRLTFILVGMALVLFLASQSLAAPENSASQPTVKTSTVASLPDGNYRYVSAKFSSFNVSDDELLKAGGYELRVRKTGNKLTGTLGQIDSGNTICISGEVSGNTVAGRAVEVSEPPFNTKDTIKSAGEEFAAWDLMGGSILKVRRGKKVGNKIEYASALLNLSGLNRINAGTRPAPVSCP
jgi:hypothetical protein